MTKEEWNLAVDNFIKYKNDKIGKPVERSIRIASSFPLAHSLITEEVIHDYAFNMGDSNPLYSSSEYAKNSVWGCQIAPPGGFVRYIAETGSFARDGVVDGMSMLYGGTEYTHFDVIRAGEEYDIEDEFLGVEEKKLAPEKAAKYRLLTMSDRRKYINRKNGKTVVETLGNIVVICTYPQKNEDAGIGAFTKLPKPCYSEEELDKLYRYFEDYYDGKLRRGANTLFFEDVSEGDVLQPLRKGPMDVIDNVSFSCAIGSQMGSAATKWQTIRYLHNLRDPETNNYLNRDAFHFSDVYANASGMPFAMVYGAYLESTAGQFITDWAGDDAFVKKIKLQQRKPAFYGDMFIVEGRVEKKYVEDGEHLVEIGFSGKNQNGAVLMPGTAVVRLRSRDEK